jgi:hypothetical protein
MTHAMTSIAAGHGAMRQETPYIGSATVSRIELMLTSLFVALKDSIGKRRRYRKMIAEIATLSQDDLIDIGAFQTDLYRSAREQVYG